MRRIFILEQMYYNLDHKVEFEARIVELLDDKRICKNVHDGKLVVAINNHSALSGKHLTEYLEKYHGLGKDEKYWFVWDGRLYSSFSGDRVHQ